MQRSLTRKLLTILIACSPAMSSCDLPIDFWVDQSVNVSIGFPWTASTSYAQGNIVVAGGNLYAETATSCTSATSGGPTTTGTAISDASCIWAFAGQVWAAGATYAQGVLVLNGGRFYKETAATCVSAASGGPTGTGTEISDATCTWDYSPWSISQGQTVSLNSCSSCQAVASQAKLIKSIQIPELWVKVTNLQTTSSASATVDGNLDITNNLSDPYSGVAIQYTGVPLVEDGRIDLTPQQSDVNTLQQMLLKAAQSGSSFHIQYGGSLGTVPFPVKFELTAEIHVVATIAIGS